MRGLVLRVDREVCAAIKNVAASKEQTGSELMRRLLETRVERRLAESAVDTIAAVVRVETRAAQRVMENRIIKILAKATGASAASMYLSVQCIAGANKRDAAKTHQRARVKAAEYLKQEGERE